MMRPRSARRGVAGHVDRAGVRRAAAESGHSGADLVLLGWRMTAAPVLAALRLLGVLINRGEQWFTARSGSCQ
jgi:hypothetical protein